MKLGFDIDGVITEINLPILRIIDLTRNSKKRRELYKYYYKGQKLNLNASKFVLEEDELYFITGRGKEYEELTRRFLEKHFKNFKLILLDLDYPVMLEDLSSWYRRQAELKAKVINNEGIDVYFEDSPEVVRHLRSMCPNTKIIFYGDRFE